MSTPAKVCVIGSNSFSGACFVEHALGRGAEVIGISRSAEPHRALLPYRWAGRDQGFRFHALDINHHLDGIDALLKAERPAHVVNFAAQSMVAESWINPEHWFQTNVVSTVKLHDRLRRHDFLERYVHVTTPEVYGSVEGFIKEDAPFNPSTPYAVSRAAADMSLRTYFAAYGFPVVFTRAANVYGAGQPLYRIIPRTLLFVRLGRKLQLHGGGVSRRSFVHGRDVADATWRVMTGGALGETYHISTDEVVSIREAVERMCALAGVPFADSVEVVGERLGKDSLYALDSAKLRDTLGWRPGTTLDAGLRDCLEWVDRFLPELRELPFDYAHKP